MAIRPLARQNPQPRCLMIIVQGVFNESSCNYVYGESYFLTTAYGGIHSTDKGEGVGTLKFLFSSDLQTFFFTCQRFQSVRRVIFINNCIQRDTQHGYSGAHRYT